MKFSLALLAVAPAVISAKKSPKKIVGGNLPAVDIKANSKTGGRIMSKARRLEQGGGDDEAMTWVAGYSLKFHSCVATDDYYGGDFNDMNENAENYQQYQYENQNQNQNQNENQNQNNANYQNGEYDAQAYQNGEENADGYYYNQANNDRQNYQGLYVNQVAHFQLCPSSSCGKWNSKNCADYVVDLGVYVQAVLEAKMEAQQFNCEQVKENCWCENAQSEDQCLYSCYENAAQKKGFDYCIDMMYDNEDDFDVVEALECKELEVDEEAVQAYYENQNYQKQMSQQQNGYNGYYNQEEEEQQEMKLYVGPMCSPNGKAVYLATFSDETCSIKAVEGIYEALNFGTSIPYSKKSLVDTGCISCKEPKEVDYQNYWDQQDPDEVTQSCSGLYEVAGKCEEGLVGYFLYRNNAGCSYINELKNPSLLANVNANVPAKVFAGIFGVTTALLAAVSAVLWKKNSRQNVSLTADHPLA